MHWTVVIFLWSAARGVAGPDFSMTMPGFWSEKDCRAIITGMNGARVGPMLTLKTSGLENPVLFNYAKCVPGEFTE
jgi:hypothetical protein